MIPNPVMSASGRGDWQTFGSGTKRAAPEATVETERHHVEIGVDYDLKVQSAALLGSDVQRQTVLGRPAVFYSSQTLAIGFNLGGSGKATSGRGPMARSLAVARDAKDGGGFYELIVWRHAAVVLNVCRRVLRDDHAAEDAFQATFVVLLGKAGSIRQGEALAVATPVNRALNALVMLLERSKTF